MAGGKDIFVPVCILPHLFALQSGTNHVIVNASIQPSLVQTSLCHLTNCSSFSIDFVAGNADAFVRLLPGIDCAIGALCHECRVVFKDFERGEENTVEMVMIDKALWRRTIAETLVFLRVGV
jgi:hypothetical protein